MKTLLVLLSLVSLAASDAAARGYRGPNLSDKSEAELVEILNTHESPSYRMKAAYELGKFRDEAGFRALMKCAKPGGPDTYVRVNCLSALADRRDARAIPLFMDTLRDEPRGSTPKMHAALRAGDFNDPVLIPLLLEAFRDPLTQYHATGSLGKLRAKAAVEPMNAYLHSQLDGPITMANRAEVSSAIFALGSIADVKGLLGLLPYLSRADLGMRREAMNAIERIGRTEGVPAQLEKEIVVPMLLGRLQHGTEADGKEPDLYVRMDAARALGERHGREITAALKEACANDPELKVRLQAATSLERKGSGHIAGCKIAPVFE